MPGGNGNFAPVRMLGIADKIMTEGNVQLLRSQVCMNILCISDDLVAMQTVLESLNNFTDVIGSFQPFSFENMLLKTSPAFIANIPSMHRL